MTVDKKRHSSETERSMAKTLQTLKNDYNIHSYNVLPDRGDSAGGTRSPALITDQKLKMTHKLWEAKPLH